MKVKFIGCYIFCWMIVLSACKMKGETTEGANNPHKKTYKLSGKVTSTSDYCGGAEPPPELLDQLATPIPYQGKTFYIKAGTMNNINAPILYTVVTDTGGNYSVQLPPGKYCMIDKFRADTSFLRSLLKNDPNSNLKVGDKKCLQDWFNSCFYAFSISDSNLTNVNFHVHRPCFTPEGVPCVGYSGPLPE